MASNPIHNVLVDYLHNLESLHEMMPLLMAMTYVSRKATHERKSAFLEKNGEVIEDNDDTKRYTLSTENGRVFSRLERKHERAKTASELLPNKILISFVSEYDAFMGSFIKCILRMKPELLNAGEKNISFSLLRELGSVDLAFEHVIDKEVNSVMRDSHAEHFKWLEKTCSIPLTKGLDSWPTFIEATERRNLFVHCDGVVNTQYLKVCSSHNCKIDVETVVGTRLTANKRYLDSSFECLYEIAVKLVQVIWRKLLPEDLDAADGSLINISYELIHEGKYRLAQALLDFSQQTLKKWSSDANRRILIINRAQSYYHAGEKDKCARILDKEDWSSCAEHFRLCVEVLQEDYDGAIKIMKSIGPDGAVEEPDYLDWPVFKELRKQQCFKEAYEEIFGKPPVNVAELSSGEALDEEYVDSEKTLDEELDEEL